MATKKKKLNKNGLEDLVNNVSSASTRTGGSQLAGYGTIAHNNNYSLLTLNQVALTYLYSSNGIIQTAIDLPTQDALSKGINILSPDMDANDIDELQSHMERTDQWTKLRHAWNWSRLYGGSGLVLNTNQDASEPLNVNTLHNSPIDFYDVNKWQLNSVTTVDNVDDDTMFSVNGHNIHSSRVLLMKGNYAPYYIRRQLRGWGLSETERMIKDLNLYLKTQNVLYEILDEAKIDVYQIEGFNQSLSTAAGMERLTQAIQMTAQAKSVLGALVLDKNDVFEQKTLSFSGVSEVMKENRIGIACAVRIPMTKLFGLPASGFNTGESDLENYNLMVESDIRKPMMPIIRKLVEFNMYHLWGTKFDFKLEWPSLRSLSALEEEQVKDSQFNRAIVAYEHGLINSQEWGEIIQTSGILPGSTQAADGTLPEAPTPPPEPTKINNSIPFIVRRKK